MHYYSTRDCTLRYTAAEAVKLGLSREGGLLTPTQIPQMDRAFLESLLTADYPERAARIMALYLTDYTLDELRAFSKNAYGPDKFDTAAVAPVHTVDESTHCLELWHGPTSAFKDMALQMLPQLLSASLGKTGEDKIVCILVATSGDTGKAAMEGFADVPQTKILVFYPKDGVSAVQEAHPLLSALSAPLSGLPVPRDFGRAGKIPGGAVLLRSSSRPGHPPQDRGNPWKNRLFPDLCGLSGICSEKNL